MKRRIIIYLYLAVLVCEDKSDALSSSVSLEDSLNTYDITVPQNPERQEVEKNDLYEVFDDFRTTNHKIDPEIIRDDLNLYVEKINQKKSKINFERDGFYNTPKSHKNTVRPKIAKKHPNAGKIANSGINNDFIVDINLFERKSRSLASQNVPRFTKILNDFKTRITYKHKHIEPFPDVSEELDTSYTMLPSNLKKPKKSEEDKRSDMFNKVVKKRNNKYSRLNKQQQSRNHSDSQNKHVKSKNSGIRLENKEYIKDRHIQPELDISFEQAEVLSEEQQYETQNKKSDIFNKVVKKRNNKYSRLNKQQQSTNHSDSQNKHLKSKNSGIRLENKKYTKDHHIQPELDSSLEQADVLSKEQQYGTQNKKSDIFNKVVKKSNNKYSKLNKQQQSTNHSDSQNKHVKSKNSGIRLENKEYIKYHHIQPELDSSLEQAEVLTKEQQYETQNKKSDIFNKVVKKRNNKYSKLSKQQQSTNHSDSQNKHVKSKNTGIRLENKEYIKDYHIQPELDIALEQAEVLSKEQQYEIQKKKGSHNIIRQSPTDFVTSKAELTKKIPIVKNVNENPRSQNDTFTLTISDINDENEEQFKANNLPSHQGSTLLDIDDRVYQHMLSQVPHEPNKVSLISKVLLNNKADSPKSTLKQSLIAKQQPVEIGMIDKNEGEHYEQLDEVFKIDNRDPHVSLGDKSNAKTEGIVGDKPNLDNIKSENTASHPEKKINVKLDKNYKPNTVKQTQPKIEKKKFDSPLNMNDKKDKLTIKEKIVKMNDDFSKAEIILTDSNESVEKSADGSINGHDQSDYGNSESIKHIQRDKHIGNILRNYKKSCTCKKSINKCRKACTGAYSSVCRRLKCSSKARRALSHQCKKYCVKTFRPKKYSSEDSS